MNWWRNLTGRGANAEDRANASLDEMIAGAREGLALLTSTHASTWRMDRAAHYDVDLDAGEIVWSFDDGTRAVAPVQVVGTLNRADGTFLWAWQHPSVPEPLAQHAALVRDLGSEVNDARLTTAKIAASEDEAWSFTALAVKLGEANGGYRGGGNDGLPLVYMTFGNVTLSREAAAEEAAPVVENGTRRLAQDPGGPVGDDLSDEALSLVRSWRAEVVAIDKTWDAEKRARKRSGQSDAAAELAALNGAIACKMAVYDRMWRRDDDYWKPCSASGNPDEANDDPSSWSVTRLDDGSYRVEYMDVLIPGMPRDRAYLVRAFDDGLRIIDFLFE